ncbi:hypothetical protein [Spiroplasma taiwanense]|uniref:Uncharacterized protein n=1 Tax=Spiroplasma taiwanense CT-1 TaxID=1276220 RepID=S5LU53_9MOLU|nr:hypothetical protein [Spiroplasma taiwanense]AGR41274.1 hypothetical protein STAIW_v1c06560 [Spiroplasma taiwanense CT-1]
MPKINNIWGNNNYDKLLQNNSKNLNVKIKSPYKSSGYTEAYFEVIINSTNFVNFNHNSLNAIVHVTYDYSSLNRQIFHKINKKISSNWSTLNTYFWENNNIWYKALNLKDYLTDEQKQTANYDYFKAFTNKFKNLKFNVNGYDNIKNYSNFSLEKMKLNVEQKVELIKFKKTSFGVYSEVDSDITVRINLNYDLEYKIYGSIGVTGFGSKWQNTSLDLKILKWEIK